MQAGAAGKEKDRLRRRGQGASGGCREGGGSIKKKGAGCKRGLQGGRRMD